MSRPSETGLVSEMTDAGEGYREYPGLREHEMWYRKEVRMQW